MKKIYSHFHEEECTNKIGHESLNMQNKRCDMYGIFYSSYNRATLSEIIVKFNMHVFITINPNSAKFFAQSYLLGTIN